MKFYRMSLEAFDNLVQMLTSYLKLKCINQSSSSLAKDQENCCTSGL